MAIPSPVAAAFSTPANLLSLLRIAASPVVVFGIFAMGTEGSWWCWALWIVVCLTDVVDGMVARRQGTTRSGAFLDPLADKALMIPALISLAMVDAFGVWPVALIVAREVAMSVYRSVLATRGMSVPARRLAKLKTWVQALAVGAALLPPLATTPEIAEVTLWLAVGLTLFTFAQYLVDGERQGRTASQPVAQ